MITSQRKRKRNIIADPLVVPGVRMPVLEITEQTPFPAIGAALVETVEAAVPMLRSMSEARAEQPRAPGKWSPKQVIGHLIDSASNNHQRFVRAQEGPSFAGPGYEQDHWVAVQGYQESSWDEIVALWRAYNRHLAQSHRADSRGEAWHHLHDRLGSSDHARVPRLRLRPAPAASPGAGGRVARMRPMQLDFQQGGPEAPPLHTLSAGD